jgi:SMODS-associating 2TM, beta-strand rich effector domain
MPSDIQVNALVLAVAALWGLLLVLQGLVVDAAWFKPFSTVVGAVVLLLAAFDNWLWRVPALQGWFVKRPHLWGTWRVTLKSTWTDPATGQEVAPITGFMLVRQTYSTVTMTLFTAESSSVFVADELALDTDGRFAVFAVYRNEPKAAVRHRSPIHYGAMKLVVQGSDPSAMTTIEGVYWTDRLTRGDIVMTERRLEKFNGYDATATAFGTKP